MNLLKTIISKFLSHPGWSGVGVLVAIAGLVISLLQSPEKETIVEKKDVVVHVSDLSPQDQDRISLSYWRAEDFYTQALYAQSAHQYIVIIQALSPTHVAMFDTHVIEQARQDYELGKFKLSADIFRKALQPLAINGVFGSKILK